MPLAIARLPTRDRCVDDLPISYLRLSREIVKQFSLCTPLSLVQVTKLQHLSGHPLSFSSMGQSSSVVAGEKPIEKKPFKRAL